MSVIRYRARRSAPLGASLQAGALYSQAQSACADQRFCIFALEVSREAAQNRGSITRVDGRRTLTVSADVESGVLATDKVQELRDWLASGALPPDVSVTFGGEDEETYENQPKTMWSTCDSFEQALSEYCSGRNPAGNAGGGGSPHHIHPVMHGLRVPRGGFVVPVGCSIPV